jgi:hypothetical protein
MLAFYKRLIFWEMNLGQAIGIQDNSLACKWLILLLFADFFKSYCITYIEHFSVSFLIITRLY